MTNITTSDDKKEDVFGDQLDSILNILKDIKEGESNNLDDLRKDSFEEK